MRDEADFFFLYITAELCVTLCHSAAIAVLSGRKTPVFTTQTLSGVFPQVQHVVIHCL